MSCKGILDSAADTTAAVTRDESTDDQTATILITPDDDTALPSHVHTIHESSIEIGMDAITYNRILDTNVSMKPDDPLECNASDITKASPLTLAFKLTNGGVLTSDEIMKQIDQWMTAAPKSAVAYSVSILNSTADMTHSENFTDGPQKQADSSGSKDDDGSDCQSTPPIALPETVMEDAGNDFEVQSSKAGDDNNIAHRMLHDGTNGLVNSYSATLPNNTIVSDETLCRPSIGHIEPQGEIDAGSNSSTILRAQVSRQSGNVGELLTASEDTHTSPSGGSESIEESSRPAQQIDTHMEDCDNGNSERALKRVGGVRDALADIQEEDRHLYEGRSISSIRNSLYRQLDDFWQTALCMLGSRLDAGFGMVIHALGWYEDGVRDYSHLDPGWDVNYEDHDPELAEAARAFLTDLEVFRSGLEAIETELYSAQRPDYDRKLELHGQSKLEMARFLVRCRQFEPVLRAAPFEDRIV